MLIIQDYDNINYMIHKVIEKFQKGRLDVNINKTEYMYVGGEQRNLTLENEQVCEIQIFRGGNHK